MKRFILEIYRSSPASLAIAAAVILFLWAIMSLIRPKGWRTFNLILIPLSLIGVAFATLIGRTAGGEHAVYLIPFEKWQWALIQPEYYREMFMNGLLFVPFGTAASYLLSEKHGLAARILPAVTAALIISSAVEYLQYRLNVGYFDIDDILCNVLGAFFGSAHLLLAPLIPPSIDYFTDIGKRFRKDRQ